MRVSIRTKLFLAMVAVSLSFIGLSLYLMDRFVGRIAEREVSAALRRGLLAYERFAALRSTLIASRSRSLAQAPHLRAVMNVPDVDHQTALFTAGELSPAAESDLMLLLDVRGRLLAEVDAPSDWGENLSAQPGVQAGLNGIESVAFWRYRDRFYRVAVTPIALADQLLGLLVLGERYDAAAAAELREVTGQEVLITEGDSVLAESLGDPGPQAVQREEVRRLLAVSGVVPPQPVRGTMGGQEALAAVVSLDGTAGRVVLFRGLHSLTREILVLRVSILAAGGMSAVLAVVLSLWLAARVSRPIRLLGAAAERFGAGQRAAVVEVGSRDELGQLSRSFNLMVAQIDERTEALRLEVAERLQAEERMRRSERYFRSLIENASDVVTVVDGGGVTRYVSPSVTRVLGHAPEDLLGAGYLKHVHPDDAGRLEEAHLRARQEPSEPVSCEFRLRHANGGWRLVQAVLNNQLADQAVAGIVANLQDVTERKQAEMRLAQTTRLESIGRLAAGIAHEINTPMQFIGDNTLFLQEAFAGLMRLQDLQTRLLASGEEAGLLPPEAVTELAATREAVGLSFLATRVPQALQRSREGVDRVSQLVRAMRELSHPGTKELVPIDLNRTIEHALVLSHHEWKYVAEARLELDPELPLVQGLPGELSQVLLNLIVNAAHAIGDALGTQPETKGTIAISTRGHGDRVEVRLRDTGTGIPAEVQPHVFDLFFTTKEVGKGTGQGLAMAHDVVVTKHRGELFFESEEGVGTTFVLRLPVDGRQGSTAGSSDG